MARNRKRAKSDRPSGGVFVLGLGLVLLGSLALLVLFTPVGGKVKRGLREVFRPDPVVVEKEVPGRVPGKGEGEPLTPLESDPDPDFPRGVPAGASAGRPSKTWKGVAPGG